MNWPAAVDWPDMANLAKVLSGARGAKFSEELIVSPMTRKLKNAGHCVYINSARWTSKGVLWGRDTAV
jgi:hypothetical protein